MIPAHLLSKLNQITNLHGWCSIEKATAMAELVLETNPKLCVELGVYGGRSLIATGFALQEANADGVVWGIDPYTINAALEGNIGDANVEWWRKLDIHEICRHALSSITAFGLWNHIRLIIAKSEQSHTLFPSIDILHIDSNHSEEKSTQDVRLWAPLVKPGGYIWFDDADWTTTQNALNVIQEYYADRVKDVVSHDSGVCRLYRKR